MLVPIKPYLKLLSLLLITNLTHAQYLNNNKFNSMVNGVLPPQTVFHYDFENDDTENYYLGSVFGQNGWDSMSSYAATRISDEYSSHGFQHLRISKDGNLPVNTIIGVISPDLANLPNKALIGDETLVSADILISNKSITDYSILGYSTTQNEGAWQIIFGYNGTIIISDDRNNDNTIVLYNTWIPWQINDYFNLKVKTSVSGDYIKYYIDDVLIYTSRNGLIGATTVEQIKFFCNNFPDDNEYASLDNLTIDTSTLFGDLIFENGFE